MTKPAPEYVSLTEAARTLKTPRPILYGALWGIGTNYKKLPLVPPAEGDKGRPSRGLTRDQVRKLAALKARAHAG